ncbi:BRCA1-A complex subunit Abraxas 1-like isoform X1 [Huso huso]|uniref:BRCA1-A complex subunit Abraxas 1 n=1 Tax=Huso huso TaxID=61971 RepID=A0ABR1ABI0_HUSHU
MAELNTTAHVSGYVLASLMFHHFNRNSDVEGFLLGGIKTEAKNSITDSQMDGVQVEYTIDIQKHIPCSTVHSFYNYVEINKEVLKKLLSCHKEQNVIGWYRQRRNTEQVMTFRERLIHQNLQKCLSNQELVFLLMTSSAITESSSTHSLEYAMYKLQGSCFHKVPVLVTNLGIVDQQDYHASSIACSSVGYTRVVKKLRSKYFNTDGSLKEVCRINEMSSALQEELKETCGKVEESERSLEKLLDEVNKLRKTVKEKKKLCMQTFEEKKCKKTKTDENVLLCQALQKLFPETKTLQTQTISLEGAPLPAYTCSADHGIDISEVLPLLLADKKENCESDTERQLDQSGSETEEDLLDPLKIQMAVSHSPTF